MNSSAQQEKKPRPKSNTKDHYNLARLLIGGFLIILGILISGSLLLNRENFMDEVNAFAAIFAGWIGSVMGYYFGFKPAQRAIDETNEVKNEKRDLEKQLSETHTKEAQTAKDLMVSKVIGVDIEDTLGKVLDRMNELGVKHIPIFKGDICKGIISDADITRILNPDPKNMDNEFLTTTKDYKLWDMPVSKFIPYTGNRVSVPPDKLIAEIKRLFLEKKLTVLWVKDEAKFLGIITRSDLLKGL